MNFDIITTWYIIYDTSKNRDYTFKYEIHPKIKEFKCNTEGVCGHPQINYALNMIKEGFVYVLDDDNIIHPNFWKILPTLDNNVIYTWDQLRCDTNSIMKGGNITRNCIDTAQFIVPRKYIGNIRWVKNERCGDYTFISEIYKKHSKAFKVIDDVCCYFNYLEDNTWQRYINRYPDLRKSGITTRVLAYDHWNKYGKKEGRAF
jgi:hypothetical protein